MAWFSKPGARWWEQLARQRRRKKENKLDSIMPRPDEKT